MLTRLGMVRLFSTEALKVINDVAKQQFTVTLADHAGDNAALSYELTGKHITFTRTEVPPVFQGKGVGRKLVQYALDHAHKNDLDVTCQCHFIKRYYEENQSKYKGLKITF